MDAQSTASAALITQAVVVGSFGGVGLVLGFLFSKRGPIIFPIYAAILFVAALVISQYPGLSFLARFSALYDVANGTSSTASAASIILGGGSGIGTNVNLLASLQSVTLGRL